MPKPKRYMKNKLEKPEDYIAVRFGTVNNNSTGNWHFFEPGEKESLCNRVDLRGPENTPNENVVSREVHAESSEELEKLMSSKLGTVCTVCEGNL